LASLRDFSIGSTVSVCKRSSKLSSALIADEEKLYIYISFLLLTIVPITPWTVAATGSARIAPTPPKV